MGMAIHSRSSEELRNTTDRLQKIKATSIPPISLFFLKWLIGSTSKATQLLPCGTCHQEHRGKDFDLQAMDNKTCQGCHSLQFPNFADGHPELTVYPYKRRTRIAFDHNSHLEKHFPEKDTKRRYSTCASCHSLDQVGQTMLTGDFPKACAECHAQELKGIGLSGGASIPFFRLPELDQEKLEIGEWPRGLYGLEQKITPYMQVFLEASAVNDPEVAKTELAIVRGDISIIESHGGLYDLTHAPPEVIDAATRISWAIKWLLFDFIARGQEALMSRLNKKHMQDILGKHLSQQELTALAVQIPVGVIQTAQQNWFPNLRKEISSRKKALPNDSALIKQHQRNSTQDQPFTMIPPIAYAVASTAYFSAFLEGSTVNIKSSMHGIPGENSSNRPWLVTSTQEVDMLILDDFDESLLEKEDGPQKKRETNPSGDFNNQAREDILGGQKESKAPSNNSKREDLDISIIDFQDTIIGDNNKNIESPLKIDIDALQSQNEEQEIDLEQQYRLDKERESGVLEGGWFLQESDFSIRYRRSGHEDKFFQAWLDATRNQSDLKAPAAKIFQNLSGWTIAESDLTDSTEKLSGSFQAGGCMRCHSLDAKENKEPESFSLKINWLAYRPTPDDHPATYFAHASHLSLVQDEKACKTCHQMKENDQEEWIDKWFASNMNPQIFSSNFKPIARESCSTCHQKNLAGDSCLLCNNYHIGHFPPPLLSVQTND
jgi:hypothetical protein